MPSQSSKRRRLTADRAAWDDDEPLGYKRPPPWGQFQKGKSGNPRGRPKGTGKVKAIGRSSSELTGLEKMLHDLLGDEVWLTLGGRKVSATRKKALVLNLFKQAMAGNQTAIRELNRFTEKVEAKELAVARAQDEAPEKAAEEKAKRDKDWFRHLVELRRRQAEAWARAASDGREEPDEPWPHPDDILIDHTTRTARVRGPLHSDDLEAWEYLRRSRDHYLARVVYHSFLEERVNRLISKMWLIALVECDLDLPKRWQISHNIGPASDRLMAMGFSKLEAMVESGAATFEGGSSRQRLAGEDYRNANRKWAPLIRTLGFRSLRHMERYGEEAA